VTGAASPSAVAFLKGIIVLWAIASFTVSGVVVLDVVSAPFPALVLWTASGVILLALDAYLISRGEDG
jgi:hypothetical protein